MFNFIIFIYMNKCKKCNKEFQVQKGLINYCSLMCRNSRTWTEDDKVKKSIVAKKSNKVKEANSLISEKLKIYWSSNDRRLKQSTKLKNTWTEERKKKYSDMMMGKKLSKNTKDKIRKSQIQRIKDNPLIHPNRLCAGIKESYPEKMVREYFEELGYINGIDFVQQFKYNTYYIDFYLPKNNICLEIDGEYWHDKNDINEIERENCIKGKFTLYRFSARDIVKKKYSKILKNLIASVAQ